VRHGRLCGLGRIHRERYHRAPSRTSVIDQNARKKAGFSRVRWGGERSVCYTIGHSVSAFAALSEKGATLRRIHSQRLHRRHAHQIVRRVS
jgi:hypothetical protein